MVAYEPRTPKYIQIRLTLRQRIEDGTYPPGTLLPSESQVAAEFDVSRATVLKALGFLKQEGWIQSQQGRGSFVRGERIARRAAPAHVRTTLDLHEDTQSELLSVAPVLADARIAAVLKILQNTPVYRRLRRTIADSVPVDLVTTFLPVDVAVGSDAAKSEPIHGSLLAHLADRKGIRADYAAEWTRARRPTADEAGLLDISDDDPVLVVTIAVYQADGTPILASTVVLPGNRHEIEDLYPLA